MGGEGADAHPHRVGHVQRWAIDLCPSEAFTFHTCSKIKVSKLHHAQIRSPSLTGLLLPMSMAKEIKNFAEKEVDFRG